MPASVLRAIALLITIACGFAHSGDAAAAGRLALVIGNSAYRNAPALDNPSNDAADLANALRGIGFDVIETRDATREAMANAVRAFSERIGSADVALFFYAGHGLQMNGENYLLPVDARIESAADVRFNTINLTDIQQEMEGGGRANIIMLDACRNNPFADKLAHDHRGLTTRGLGRLEATGVGSLVVFSTQPNNVAFDGAGRNSPFTSALLKHIAAPGLEVRQMISKVRGDVLAATEQKQVPWDNSSLVGDVYLAGGPQSAAAAPAPAPAAAPPAPTPTPVAAAPAAQTAMAAPVEALRGAAAPAASGPTSDCERAVAQAPPFATPEQIKAANHVDWAHAKDVCNGALATQPTDPTVQLMAGVIAEHFKNYVEAARFYRTAVDAGDRRAENALAYLFVTGQGVVKNPERAFELFAKSAEAGWPPAMGNLGSMYGNGMFVKEDDAKALEWYEKAIEAGNYFGLAQAGVMYFNGKGTPRDYTAAAQYFQQAADMGDGYSLKFLAIMYERGLLGNRDPNKAAELRVKAAQLDPDSQTPDVPPQQTAAPRPTTVVHRYVRIRRYRFIGCGWVWC